MMMLVVVLLRLVLLLVLLVVVVVGRGHGGHAMGVEGDVKHHVVVEVLHGVGRALSPRRRKGNSWSELHGHLDLDLFGLVKVALVLLCRAMVEGEGALGREGRVEVDAGVMVVRC